MNHSSWKIWIFQNHSLIFTKKCKYASLITVILKSLKAVLIRLCITVWVILPIANNTGDTTPWQSYVWETVAGANITKQCAESFLGLAAVFQLCWQALLLADSQAHLGVEEDEDDEGGQEEEEGWHLVQGVALVIMMMIIVNHVDDLPVVWYCHPVMHRKLTVWDIVLSQEACLYSWVVWRMHMEELPGMIWSRQQRLSWQL